MKLYATITSERASKGQGGNEHLYCTIGNEDKETLFKIAVWIGMNNKARVRITDWSEKEMKLLCEKVIELPKAKRQKGEEWYEIGQCQKCGENTNITYKKIGDMTKLFSEICPNCGAI